MSNTNIQIEKFYKVVYSPRWNIGANSQVYFVRRMVTEGKLAGLSAIAETRKLMSAKERTKFYKPTVCSISREDFEKFSAMYPKYTING